MELALSEYREIVFGNYRIIYHYEDNEVEILRVINCNRLLRLDDLEKD